MNPRQTQKRRLERAGFTQEPKMTKQARVVSRYTETEWMPFRKAARMFLTLSGMWGQVNQWRLEVRK